MLPGKEKVNLLCNGRITLFGIINLVSGASELGMIEVTLKY